MTRSPLVVSYGAGVDSTAVLVGMQQRGIRPDLILFADVGAEKPETYAYLPVMNAWLASVGFPQIAIVRYQPTRAPYTTLEGKCLANETMPSLAYGGHSCSIVFKAQPQEKYLKSWAPAVEAWLAGGKVTRAIGYDNGRQDCARRAKADVATAKTGSDAKFDWWYPLQDWGIDREACIALIESAGLPVPLKSACFFCPASKKHEVEWLRDTHPELFARALAVEARALTGKHEHGSTKGLGRKFAWAAHVVVELKEAA